MKLLGGDIGGTHSRLLLAEASGDKRTTLCEHHYRNDDFKDLISVLDAFCHKAGVSKPLDQSCIAVAGPITARTGNQQVQLTNRPWSFTSGAVSAVLCGTPTAFINDFEAIGWGLPLLESRETTTLQTGNCDPQAPYAALGAGSGLGTVVALTGKNGWQVIPSEGGHTDLGPGNDDELLLLEALWEHYGHASWERLVSGPGLEFIYRTLDDRSSGTATPLSAPEISRAGMENRDATAVAALRTFCRLYGAQAGNLALTVLPRGGLFLAGGIAPQVLKPPFVAEFMDRFLDKGRMRHLLERIPVQLVTSQRTGLLGAIHCAQTLVNR